MKTYLLVSTMLILPVAACWVPKIPGDDGAEEMVGDGDGDGDGDSESTGTETGEETETGEPLVDLPEGDGDGDPDPGWCCECGTDPLSCTPSSEENCTPEGFEWCLPDAEGNPSDCEAACEPVEPEVWCCDCGAAPPIQCRPAEGQACEGEQFECVDDLYPAECLSQMCS